MKSHLVASLMPHTTPQGRRLLVGHVSADIAAGSVLALTREPDSESYALHAAVPDPGDARCPSSLASFIPPDALDEVERVHAAAMATAEPDQKPSRPRKRRKPAGGAAE